jgi:hypothetical protein
LLKQIADLRRELDPNLLERARVVAEARMAGPRKPAQAPAAETVPYDREAATAAIRAFLASKKDGGRFQAKLSEVLTKAGISPDAVIPPPVPPRPLSTLKPNPGGKRKPPPAKKWWPW